VFEVAMNFDRLIVYAVGVLLIVVGLFKRRNSLRARNVTGNVVVGENSATINQSYQPNGAREPSPAPDRVAWAIAIVGVLIAAAQLSHDMFWGK
jgi:hypothetical protein